MGTILYLSFVNSFPLIIHQNPMLIFPRKLQHFSTHPYLHLCRISFRQNNSADCGKGHLTNIPQKNEIHPILFNPPKVGTRFTTFPFLRFSLKSIHHRKSRVFENFNHHLKTSKLQLDLKLKSNY